MSISTLIHRVLRRNRSGTAAVETGFVLLPFLMVLVGVFETGTFIGQKAILQDAVKTASRLISTGQIDSSGKAQFLSTIAQNTYGLIDTAKLSVTVTAYPSFSAVPASFQPLFDASGKAANQNFQTGTGNQVVVVQVGDWYTLAAPALLPTSTGGASVVTSTLVFRNEPF